MSENKKYYYLKLKENFFRRAEIILLENMQDGITYSNILLKIYLLSLEFNGYLRINENMSYTPSMLAQVINNEIGTVERALKVFFQLGLITQFADGTLYMTDIEDMVGKSSTEADRKKLSRAKLKLLDEPKVDKCPLNVQTLSEIRPPEIEIEKELEIKLEKEIERELYGRYKNVSLTPLEHKDLQKDYPLYANKYIEKLSEYMESTGKFYKNHYATICSWLKQDVKKSNYTCEEGESL